MKVLSALVLSAAVVTGLAGCSLTATSTVPAASIAGTAAHALQQQGGTSTTPKMDCGRADIQLSVGKKVYCVVTDPGNGKDYNATITITSLSGNKYGIDVHVAKVPNN